MELLPARRGKKSLISKTAGHNFLHLIRMLSSATARPNLALELTKINLSGASRYRGGPIVRVRRPQVHCKRDLRPFLRQATKATSPSLLASVLPQPLVP